MKTEREYLEMIEAKTPLSVVEYREFSRLYLATDDKRLCTVCFKIYDGIALNFHIKKYHRTHNKTYTLYSTTCKICKSSYNLTYRKTVKNDIPKYVKHLVISIKSKAKKYDIAFDIDAAHLLGVLSTQNYKCFYSNESLDFTLDVKARNSPHRNFPSLDRLDPNVGYVKGNVVWCLYFINRMKNDLTMHEFVETCKKIVDIQNDVNIV